jgi:phospholipid-translocating ATPase
MQAIFTIQYFFVALPIYNGFLLLGYSTIFTMLPVFSLVLDEDISREVALEYPILYKTTQAGNELNAETFIYWVIMSVYQGAVIMILIDLLLGVESFYMISTISFTCLILIEFLNLITAVIITLYSSTAYRYCKSSAFFCQFWYTLPHCSSCETPSTADNSSPPYTYPQR